MFGPRVCWRLRPHNFFAFSSSLQENHNTMRRATVIATKSAASPAAVAVQARALAQSQRLYATAVRVPIHFILHILIFFRINAPSSCLLLSFDAIRGAARTRS